MVAAMLAASACGGSSGPAESPSSAPSPSVTSVAPGLINDVKRAAVVAVCTNLKQASELVGIGIATDQERAAIVAAIGQLSRPPHPTAALRLAAILRRDVRRQHLAAAINTGLAWCKTEGV